MKDFDAMLLSVTGARPRRAGAEPAERCSASPPTRRPAGQGAENMVEQHPDEIDGCTRRRRGRRLQRHRARKAHLPDRGRREGMAWMKLTAAAGPGTAR